jgi:hypothetical protein
MVAKRDDTKAGGFRFYPWTPVDDADMWTRTSFKDARDELRWLINNVAYARPEDERPALEAVGDRLLLHDDQTIADVLKAVKTAMIASQPKHSKADHQKYRSDQKAHYAMLRTTLEIYYATDDNGIDPGERHAAKLVQRKMADRAKDPNRDYDIKVPSLRTISRTLAELAKHRKSKPAWE